MKVSIILFLKSISNWQYILFFLYLSIPDIFYAQDIMPPQIIKVARDTSFECSTATDHITQLTEWYNNVGGAVATDSSGVVIWKQDLTLQQCITIFNNSQDILCGNKQKVDVIFTPEDSSGNKGTAMKASFFTTDTKGPRILNAVPNLTYNCVHGIRDTLIAWIKNKGGYIANDLCSNSITWKNFNYSISASNTVIQTGGGLIENGPYPQLPDGICNWKMNISWIAVDECGNESATPGTTSFTLNDNMPPIFINPPSHMTTSFDMVPSPPNIVVIDDCNKTIKSVLQEVSTKSTDTTSCNHYNYSITRTWTATDKCGNAASHIQTIIVKDTIGPIVTSDADITIGCQEFEKAQDSITINYKGESSGVLVSYVDTVRSSGCITKLERTYTLKDTCQNITVFKQNIQVINNAKPKIITPAGNESVACTDESNLEGQLADWLNHLGGASAQESCSPLKSFAAIKGSYDLKDPTTFPGTLPTSIPKQQCPSSQNQFVRFVDVDFVFYDSCGNAVVTSAIFGVHDTLKPVIVNCPQPISVAVSDNICQTEVTLDIPVATDNCVESISPLVRKTTVNVTGPVGNEVIIPTLTARLSPFNPTLASPMSDGKVTVSINNFDIGDVTEFFNVIGEDGISLGRSPQGKDECSTVKFDFTIEKEKLYSWIQDGAIELKFVSNEVSGNPSLSINNFCANSNIEVSLSFDIEITNTVTRLYQIDNGSELSLSTETQIKHTFEKGDHNVLFIFKDCANNRAVCNVPVIVKDNVKPTIQCPENIITSLSPGQCTDTLVLPIDFLVTENCGGLRQYNTTAPANEGASFITFIYNENKMKFEARTKEIVFSDVFPLKHINVPVVLEIEFLGDNNESGEYFDIYAPGGTLIGNTLLTATPNACGTSKTRFEINKTLFNTWIQNNQIAFIAIPKNDGDGINPCSQITPGQLSDNTSKLTATLKYSDASFSTSVSGATTMLETDIPKGTDFFQFVLNAGINNVLLQTKDNSGNNAGCSFTVEVKDIENPIAHCKNIVIDLHPSGLVPFIIDPTMIDDGSTDNCKIKIKKTIPSSLDCSSAGNDVRVQFLVEDEYGNTDSCISIIKVKVKEIKPSFSAGLCANDTLKLFSNIPSASIPGTYTYHWDGPGSKDFFVENPHIPNPDESYNGVYILTVKGFNNCTTTASLTVNIKPLIKPELTVSEKEICAGEEIILTSTPYSGTIEYQWFEGIYPTGILIKKTSVSELVLKPTDGLHFYYIIAQGPDCNSSPSSLLKVEVKSIPKPELCSSFLSVCEGGDLILCAKGYELFSYNWLGPAGYLGSGFNPGIIKNTSFENAGEYRLVVANGTCISDTVITRVIILEKPPQPTLVSADIFCEGSIFSIVAATTATSEKYEWYKNGILFNTTQENSLIINNAQATLQGSWTAITTKGNCKSAVSKPKFVAIDNRLEVGAINNGPVCAGDSVLLQATFVPNATYKWKGPVPDIPDVFNPIVPGVPGDYSVVISTTTGCQNNASTSVILISVPEITALSNDAKPCMSATDQIRFSPSVFPNSENYTYQWRGPNGFLSSIRNPMLTNLSAKDTGIYQLVILNNKCPSAKIETRVSFNIIPQKPTTFSPLIYCVKDTIRIQASNTGIVDGYAWNTPLGKFNTTAPILTIPSASPANNGKYALETVKNGCNSPPSDILSININQPPNLTAQALDDNIIACPGEFVRLVSTSGPPLVNVNWSSDHPDLIFSDKNALSPTVSGFKFSTYKVFLSYSVNGCPDFTKDTILITIDSIPILKNDDYVLNYGEKQVLNVLQNDLVNSESSIRSVTQPEHGKIDIKNRMLEFTPDLRFLRPLTFTYKVCAGYCDNLCSEATVTLEFDDEVTCKAPTIFTPNNDGFNDQFVIPCLDTGRFPNTKVYIFNEWGTEVFYAFPYKNNWEGTYNGTNLPVGTYFYIIDTGEGKKPLNGFLILQR